MALTDVKSEQIQSSVALAGSPTTTTQSASDNSTKIATTAYVETAVANLVASAPAALNTLDELAAALNDDASFSTTVTNSIATKLPLAGGTLTGNLRINTTLGIGANASSVIGVYVTKSLANGLAAELTNSESSTGSGIVVRGGNNASTYSADFRDYNSNSLMRIRGDGSVGIGTASPSAGLHVVADVNPVMKLDRGSANTANANLYYNGTLTGQISAASANFQISAAGSSTPMSFYVNGSERMRLLANGSAVIGEGNSFAQQGGGLLTLEGPDANMLVLHRTADTGDQEIIFMDHGDHNATVAGKDGGGLRLLTNGRSTTALDISSTGIIGMGTTAASSYTYGDLVIDGSTGSGNASGITLVSSNTSYGGIFFADGTSGDEKYRGFLQYNHNYTSMVDQFLFGTGGATRMVLSSAGKLGLGNTDPQGDIHLQHGSTNTFTASNDSWHTIVLHNNAAAATNTTGIALEVSGSAYHGNAGTGIAAVKNGTNSDYGADLAFITRPQSAVAAERMRITDTGQCNGCKDRS